MLSVKVNEPCGTIILERPEKCNALNRTTLQELGQAIDDLHQEKRVRCILLTGAGSHFCTGLDVKEMKKTSEQDDAMQRWHEDSLLLHGVVEKILQSPKPVIAAVDGHAAGAGFALVLACDLVVATHRAKFSVPAPKLGLVSGLCVPMLCFRTGGGIASGVLLGGRELTAESGKELGFVHHVVDPDQVWVRAKTWGESIAEGAAESLQLTKRVLNEMVGEQLSSQLASGAAAAATALTTEAAQVGIAAFVEKRQPEFP